MELTGSDNSPRQKAGSGITRELQVADKILGALSGEEVLYSNALATVASKCVVLRQSAGHSQSIISLSSISGMRINRVSYPGLLVIASGLFLLAAAAYFSKDGGTAKIPLALIGLVFVFAYLGSRRASVSFIVDSDEIQTILGSSSEASALVKAVREAQDSAAEEDPPEPSEIAS